MRKYIFSSRGIENRGLIARGARAPACSRQPCTVNRTLVFFWENLGPYHSDRIEAVVQRLGAGSRVVGVQIYPRSQTYDWLSEAGSVFEKRTVFRQGEKPGFLRRLIRIGRVFAQIGRGDYFLCHYERPEVLFLAWILRLTGSRLFVMGDSKFDDYTRHLWREVLKKFFLLPYHGACSSGLRSQDYLRFLRFRQDRIKVPMNTISVARWRKNAGITSPAPCTTHAGRPFVCVARFVPKKNLSMLIDAYALYRDMVDAPRDLDLCGGGPMEEELRSQVSTLGLESHVRFFGFLQAEDVAKILSGGLALILPSTEEQFGNVVIEAQACGLPVILSENCGARDHHVRSGVNGFVVEPDNPMGLAFFMKLLCCDGALWSRMARAAWDTAGAGDVARFAEMVESQIATTEDLRT